MKAGMSISIVLLLFAHVTFGQEIKTFKEFYPNGKLRSLKHEGLFNGCIMPVGTDTMFFVSGKIQATTFYDNLKSKTQAGCHAGWTIENRKTFFENGHLRTFAQEKYSYEGSPCNCGTWLWMQPDGKVVKRKKYGNCYDQKACQN